jgi:nuclear cap-binding protein subunit 1
LGQQISSREDVKGKLSEIKEYVDSNPSMLSQMAQDHGLDSITQIPHDALLQSLMNQGSKSFSHLLNVIESYLPLLQEWNSTEEERSLSTRIVCGYWQFNSQFQEIILGKLVNYRVLDSQSVVSWVLSASTLDDKYSRIHVWSILTSTLTKVNLKIEQLLLRLEKVEDLPKNVDAMTGSIAVLFR